MRTLKEFFTVIIVISICVININKGYLHRNCVHKCFKLFKRKTARRHIDFIGKAYRTLRQILYLIPSFFLYSERRVIRKSVTVNAVPLLVGKINRRYGEQHLFLLPYHLGEPAEKHFEFFFPFFPTLNIFCKSINIVPDFIIRGPHNIARTGNFILHL